LYCWYILGACFLILFFNTGARMSFGVLLKPMAAAFHWNRGEISAAFLLHMAVYALSLVVVGKLYDRYGPKWVIVISTLFLAAGYLLTACITSLWQFFLCYGVLAAIGLGGTSVPLIAALMSKWFATWRGLAISVTLCGGSLGQFVLVPLLTSFIARFDWPAAYIVMGLVMLLVNVVLALMIIRGDPEDLGQQAFGAERAGQPPVSARTSQRDLSLREACRTPSFWCFFIAMFVCGGGDFLVATHLIPLVTDHGLDATTGGRLLAWYGLLSVAGLLLAGPASDMIGSKIPLATTFLLRVVLFLLVVQAQTPMTLTLFALAFGFTHLVTAPLTPILVGRLYGLTHVGVIAGMITTVHHLAGGLWVYMGGEIFDRTQSYRLAFLYSAILACIAFACSLGIRERR
jgi:MFS family permease